VSAFKIRLANIQDLESLSLLFDAYRQFYEHTPDVALAKNFISDRLNNKDSVILVAQNSSQILIGFCQIYPSFCSVIAAKVGVLYDLFVIESARKAGSGRALMVAAQEYAINNNYARLDLSTSKNNHTAQALYESLGWVRDEAFYTYSKEF
jgi:ribosomal protein S18 acetylase RimI-like enzyme